MVYVVLFVTGGLLYVLLELFWRGRSHISMALAGGASLVLMAGVFSHVPGSPMLLRALLGAVVITAIEFVTGAVVNVRLRLGVWDYSHLPYNCYGQICLRYSLLWVLLSAPAAVLIGFVRALF